MCGPDVRPIRIGPRVQRSPRPSSGGWSESKKWAMAPLEGATPIENDDHVLRARRTAAMTRIVLGIFGVDLILAQPHLPAHRLLALLGFCTIAITALVQRLAPRLSWLKVEESLAGVAAVLIV